MKDCHLSKILSCLLQPQVKHLHIENEWILKERIKDKWSVETLTIECTNMKKFDLKGLLRSLTVSKKLVLKGFPIQDIIEQLYLIELDPLTQIRIDHQSEPLKMGELNTIRSYLANKGPLKVVTPYMSIPLQVQSVEMAKELVSFYRQNAEPTMQAKQLVCESMSPEVIDYMISQRDYLDAQFKVGKGWIG